jgi:hypothetical protein
MFIHSAISPGAAPTPDIKQKYGSSTNITITLAGLTDTSKRQALAIDNSSNLFHDALLGGKILIGAGAAAGDYIDLFVSASADGGDTYGGDCSGSDAAYTGPIENLVFLGRIATETASVTYEFGPYSIAAAYGGVLPDKWTLVVDNQSDTTLNATPANHEIHYMGLGYQKV